MLGVLVHAPTTLGEPSLIGQTGLVHMPDARIEGDGVLRFGTSYEDPYFTLWSSVSFFPRLELSARYIKINRVPGFADAPELGDYRDKAFDAKLLLLEESQFAPAIAFGTQDYIGTRLFPAHYVAFSKRVGDFDITAGYGERRIDGLFGGLRYSPSALPGWSLVLEQDANDYRRDFRADVSGVGQRPGGFTYALEYRSGWYGTQLSFQDGDVAGNVYVAIPLMQREFVPKIDEPAPYDIVTPRAPAAEWGADTRYAVTLAQALDRQGFSDIRLRLQGNMLELALAHGRISLVGRAVGRAARTALRLGPSDMNRLRITYTANEQPLLTYEFHDMTVLARYLAGSAARDQLQAASAITYASSEIAGELYRDVVLMRDADDAEAERAGRFLTAPRPAEPYRGFGLVPFNVRIFFNDPGAPVRYDTFSVLTYRHRFDRGLFLNGAARLTLFENVSDIRQPSTSLLPHVRSDIGEYRREGGRLRLDSLLLNKYSALGDRVYGRLSAGYYEEMYAGGGGQVLYLPRTGDWVADIAVDALKQRAPGEAFGFRDYFVVTAITSLHRRFPSYGVTATARVGRFLAKDEGVRFELKRRFRSGVEIGGWYTWTNEKDITNPGTPENPYYDKGLFVSIPLNSMLTRDTQDSAGMALADYTRDVGQLVTSPGDLYRLIERSLVLDSAEHDPLTDFTR